MAESQSSFYFASRRPRTSSVNVVSNEIEHRTPRQERSLAKQLRTSPREAEQEIIERLPTGAKREDFVNYSRPIQTGGDAVGVDDYVEPQKVAPKTGVDPPMGSLLLPRAVPIKIEPKVFFAVERTFLLWMHSALWLLAASMGILAHTKDDPHSFLYGVTLFPVGIVFIIYALYKFLQRVRRLQVKHPGPYEDIKGPVILSLVLMLSIVVQFSLKLYDSLGFSFGD